MIERNSADRIVQRVSWEIPGGCLPEQVQPDQFETLNTAAKSVWGAQAQPHSFQGQVYAGVIAGRDVVLSVPTGAGKTGTVALMAAACRGVHLIVVPTRALQRSVCIDVLNAGVICCL
jgi:replicative superfamily II helicase